MAFLFLIIFIKELVLGTRTLDTLEDYPYNHRNSSDAFPEGTLGPYFIPQIPELRLLFGIIS